MIVAGPRVVIGTAGHIDHGKTTLLRALTGIDADRLPEEQRRGMTIDVGYAHLDVPDGEPIDFVDVPGHDRLVGNMLVGAGEIDAAMLVVAANDGPRPQTMEHLELLDALGIEAGIVVITKADLVDAETLTARVTTVAALLAGTRLAAAPILAASAATGAGMDQVRVAVLALAARVARDRRPVERTRLAIDRAFAVRGRGAVVTGSLRGGAVERNDLLWLEPGAREVRVREVQAHGTRVDRAVGGGRVALNLAAIGLEELSRGLELAAPGIVTATRRLLVALSPARDLVTGGDRPLPAHGERLRLHAGTTQAEAIVVRNARTSAGLTGGATTALLRLDRPIAASFGDRFVLRRPSPGATAAGGRVLDPLPPLGPSRRRATSEALVAVAAAGDDATLAGALVRLHGAVPVARLGALDRASGGRTAGPTHLAADVAAALESAALALVAHHAAAEPLAAGLPLATLRPALARDLRRRATLDRDLASGAAQAVVDALVAGGRLVAAGDRVRLPGQAAELPTTVIEAMERVEAALSSAAPRPLSEVARAAGCPPEGVRALESAGRIVRLEPEIAYSRATYGRLAALALRLATSAPLTPAAYRDATGTSRRYALAILEDLDRRGLLRRTPDGHVPGPRAPRPAVAAS